MAFPKKERRAVCCSLWQLFPQSFDIWCENCLVFKNNFSKCFDMSGSTKFWIQLKTCSRHGTQDNNPSRIDDGCGREQSACAETYGDGRNEQLKRCFARVRVWSKKKNNTRQNQHYNRFSKIIKCTYHRKSSVARSPPVWPVCHQSWRTLVRLYVVMFVESFTFPNTGLGLSRQVSHRWFHLKQNEIIFLL